MSSDDASELRLSTNHSPANLRTIAAQASYNGNREYLTGRRGYERRSAPIYLEAGKRYFCEALHKEGTGGDNFAVAWWRTNDPPIVNGSAPISGSVLEKFVGVAFSKHPASVTTSKGRTVTLAAAAYIGVGAVSYQWLKDGGAVSGANALTYVISSAQTSHSGVYKLRNI